MSSRTTCGRSRSSSDEPDRRRKDQILSGARSADQGVEEEIRQFTDRFYRSLQGNLDAALESGEIADDDVESFFDIQAKFWPGLGLRRQDWPKGNEDPDVRLEWSLKWTCFSASANVVCGVRTTVERYRQPFTKEMRPGFPKHNHAWPTYKNVDPPDGRFWEGDNLKNTATTSWRPFSRHGMTWPRWWTKQFGHPRSRYLPRLDITSTEVTFRPFS